MADRQLWIALGCMLEVTDDRQTTEWIRQRMAELERRMADKR